MSFALHPQLAADTVEVAVLDLCRVQLMDDATFPWLILVPAVDGLKDLHDVSPAQDATLMAEVRQASQVLAAIHAPDKINVAALGNAVPQLHIHVIARFTTDAAWPKPVWGAAPRAPYETSARDQAVAKLRAAFEEYRI
jgi:diadenosine tetraphosphate (Ap4A) HIT family hydrolase